MRRYETTKQAIQREWHTTLTIVDLIDDLNGAKVCLNGPFKQVLSVTL